MRGALPFVAAALVAAGAAAPRVVAQAEKQLQIHFVDVEGGQATLLVAPTGESMLIDAGFPGNGGRDADRIVAAAKQAGVSRLDTLVVTHYHADHVGGVPPLAAKLPIRRFVDHGPTVEKGDRPEALFTAYMAVRDKGQHVIARPGDAIQLGDVDVRFLSAAGNLIDRPLPGAGGPNPSCAEYKPKDPDATENAQSVGMLVSYGQFRMLDLGDLTWNKEHDLVCPNNLIGTVDLYVTTHHGTDLSGLPALVHAVHPRAAIMNNGARKGGSVEAWTALRKSPGLSDIWQLHYAVGNQPEFNAPQAFIANIDESTAFGIAALAGRDGSFIVTNRRNAHSGSYSK
jgi:beta-lactamase superfamily II metal-dependent hydrolase